jgi:UDP-N-acetylmuramoyl-tripeptide--D-alanyl-D-alanine ligase
LKLPLDVAIRATDAALLDGEAAPATLRVSTDTRTIEPGDAFLALRGDRFDGHDFVAQAVARGAAMLVLDRAERHVPGVATLLVDQTLRAYMALGGAARGLFEGTVVAITGSAGKTTTKAFLTQLLGARYGNRLLTAPENENNEIGVSKLLLQADNLLHDVVVAEFGARHYGDIAQLVAIGRPQIGILTNIGEAHLEIMGSRERLEATKWALFARGARPVLNAGDSASRARAPRLAEPARWFAAERSEVQFDPTLQPLTALVGDRLLQRSAQRASEFVVDVRMPGMHNRANVAAALAGALELGLSLEVLIKDLPTLRLPPGRYDRLGAVSGIRLIYDAYNANASGMIAALDAFAAESASRRIAVLASMAELGDESKDLHERVGAHAAGRVDILLVRGEYAAELARGAQRAGLESQQIVEIGTNAQAARWLRDHARPDDVVLLKGSRKYKLEEIVEELRT